MTAVHGIAAVTALNGKAAVTALHGTQAINSLVYLHYAREVRL